MRETSDPASTSSGEREFDLVEILRARVGGAGEGVVLGIGDDAALLVPREGHEIVVATDTLVAGVHFVAAAAPADIGWKSLAVNLSDLAAMGAEPAFALLALTLPDADASFVERFADGFGELARAHGVALIGGDTTSGPLNVNVSAIGFVPRGMAVRRDGARPGDEVFVTGTLGDAAAALRCRQGDHTDADVHAIAALCARLDRPMPRIAAGLALRAARASACIDVSDGLLADLGHVARRSGAGIEIDATALPASAALSACFDGVERIALQAAGGDDYELAFTLAPADAGAMIEALAAAGECATRIGRVVEGEGVRLLDAARREIALPRRGWEHFR